MAKYSYITDKTHNNRKIQVESAKRDGSGKNIENNYAKQNGNYQSLTAGLSNNFDTKKVMVDESAYNFRPTATIGSVELEVGSPCKVKKIIGGSVAFNQLSVARSSGTYYGLAYTNNNGSISISGTCSETPTYNQFSLTEQITFKRDGRKYLITSNQKIKIGITGYVSRNTDHFFFTDTSGTNWNGAVFLYVSENDVVSINNLFIQCFDLTQMFGSTIADYIYSLEQANAGSGVAWFKRYFPKEYYDYNSGELVSVKTQGKKITHFNQCDEVFESGGINPNNGGDATSSTSVRTKNYQRVLPNASYYIKASSTTYVFFYDINKNYLGYYGSTLSNRTFTISDLVNTMTDAQDLQNVAFVRFRYDVASYNNDFSLNFHYDGERDGEYEPYNSETYACDDIELRGIPQLDENNNLAFDGDEYANDGNVKRKKYVQMFTGSETGWEVATKPNTFMLECNKFPVRPKNSILDNNTTFVYGSWKKLQPQEIGTENGIYTAHTYTLYVTAMGCSTLSELQTYLASNPLILGYDISETIENSIPFTEVQECDNWGTEEWLAPTTDTRPCEVPVGHETDYLPDLKAKVEVAPNTPNENGVYVMEHNASGNSYTHIATWLTDNGYAKTDNLYGVFGAKKTAGGILRKMLAEKYNIDFKNTAVCDLSELSYSYDASYPNVFSASSPADILLHSFNGDISILCSEFVEIRPVWRSGVGDLEICQVPDNLGFTIKDTRYNNIADFKNAMKGVLLAYEKAS